MNCLYVTVIFLEVNFVLCGVWESFVLRHIYFRWQLKFVKKIWSTGKFRFFFFWYLNRVFCSSFRLPTKLSKSTENFHTPLPHTHRFPHIPLFIITEEPALIHYHSKSIVSVRDYYSLCYTVYGFDRCIRSCVHRYKILQSSFTALKFLCPTCHSSFLSQSQGTPTCLHSFAFPRMSCSWNHMYGGLSDGLH